ncbi:hypothetical protein CDD81_7720 [Ophiocordyceps australis]|uniref:Uncharacterized protein n=1 Tax=Ophiocordyceps australis TaxID=1399860 RepID=A0A2C5XXD9_9HYPO|nr:hypothetical protein CDD81_7720 [Ophiocordyceps australis]
MKPQFLVAALWVTVQSQGASVDIKHSELGEYFIKKQIKELESNLQLDMENLPASVTEIIEPTCAKHWIYCHKGVNFTQKLTLLPGKQIDGDKVNHQGLNVSLILKRQVLRRTRNTMFHPVTISRTQQYATIESTTEGWNFGAQLSGSFMQALGEGILGTGGLSISASHSRFTSTGTQVSVADSSTFNCPSNFVCWSESWVPYVKISGPCKGQAWIDCGGEQETCSTVFLKSACSQFHHWKAKVCPGPSTCEIMTPVMEGDRPWVTEVYFEDPIMELHPKPIISGYQSGYYLLSSADYRYDPLRTNGKYWTPREDWHDNRAWPTLDEEIAKFNHSVPKIVTFADECYWLDTLENYCPWNGRPAHYYFTKGVPYTKPTAPDPSTQDIVDFLQLENGMTDTQVMAQYLKLFNREHGLPLDQPDFNARNQWQQTPLIWGVIQGHEIMVQLLLGNPKVELFVKDFSSRTALSWAAGGGYLVLVKHMLAIDGSDLNFADDKGRTALWWAVHNRHETVMQQLLSRPDMDVAIQDDSGHTALWWAVHGGKARYVEAFVAVSNKVPSEPRDYWSKPLVTAAERGFVDIVRLIIKQHNVQVNYKDDMRQTPLSAAAKNGHNKVVNVLLKHEFIDANTLDYHRHAPLHYSVKRDNVEMTRWLLALDSIDVNIRDYEDSTALLSASKNGNLDLVNLLLDKNADPNLQNNHNLVPIAAAAGKGHFSVVKKLAHLKNINLNHRVQSEQSTTMLLFAVKNNNLDLLRILIKNNADANVHDDYLTTPLMLAAQTNNTNAFKLLLNKTSDINSRNYQGRTVLSFLAENGNHELIQFVTNERNPDPNIHDQDYKTPVAWAAEKKHFEALRLILDMDAILVNTQDRAGRTPLSYLAENGWHDMIKLLISRFPSANLQDKGGKTPLMWAIEKNHLEAARLILDIHFINVNLKDRRNWTALAYAAKVGNPDIVSLVLAKDPDPNIQDEDQRTALQWAAERGHFEALKLIARSPRTALNHRDISDRSALAYAVLTGNTAMVKLLLDTGLVDPVYRGGSPDFSGPLPLAQLHDHSHIAEMLLNATNKNGTKWFEPGS